MAPPCSCVTYVNEACILQSRYSVQSTAPGVWVCSLLPDANERQRGATLPNHACLPESGHESPRSHLQLEPVKRQLRPVVFSRKMWQQEVTNASTLHTLGTRSRSRSPFLSSKQPTYVCSTGITYTLLTLPTGETHVVYRNYPLQRYRPMLPDRQSIYSVDYMYFIVFPRRGFHVRITSHTQRPSFSILDVSLFLTTITFRTYVVQAMFPTVNTACVT